VASKLFYHLESYEESLNFALVAGEYFNLEISDQYVDTLVQTCIDKYISLKKQSYDLKQRVLFFLKLRWKSLPNTRK